MAAKRNIWQVHCHAVLTVPITGGSSEIDRANHGKNSVNIPIRIHSFELERNDHLTADSLKIAAEWNDANIDPRFLRNATVQFWAGVADEDGNWSPNDDNLRFVGVMIHCSRKMAEGGMRVDLDFHDYTDFFLRQKPYASNGIPHYNSSLRDAWQRICDHVGYWDISSGKMVSAVDGLRNALYCPSGAGGDATLDLLLAVAVPKRLAEFGRIGVGHGSSAWDVWQSCVFSLGLISYFDKDRVIVTTTTEHFAVSDAPVVMFGRDILDADEVVDASASAKGIGLVSYDVLTGTTIEAFYPRPGDVRINTKRAIANKQAKGKLSNDFVQAESYEIYEYHSVSDPDVLQKIAQRAYEERSRQEIQGVVKTVEPVLYTPSGVAVDVMSLGAGENIRVQIDPDSLELIRNEGGLFAQRRLIELGYEPSVAAVLAKNLDSMGAINSNMHTRQVTTRLDGEAETFEVTIKYWNVIRPLGGDTAG